MPGYKVSYGCGDYPTNELSSDRTRLPKEDEEYNKEMIRKGYHQDSTGCWFHPNHPSVFGENV